MRQPSDLLTGRTIKNEKVQTLTTAHRHSLPARIKSHRRAWSPNSKSNFPASGSNLISLNRPTCIAHRNPGAVRTDIDEHRAGQMTSFQYSLLRDDLEN